MITKNTDYPEFEDKFGIYEQQYIDGIINVPPQFKLIPHQYFEFLVEQDRLNYQKETFERLLKSML